MKKSQPSGLLPRRMTRNRANSSAMTTPAANTMVSAGEKIPPNSEKRSLGKLQLIDMFSTENGGPAKVVEPSQKSLKLQENVIGPNSRQVTQKQKEENIPKTRGSKRVKLDSKAVRKPNPSKPSTAVNSTEISPPELPAAQVVVVEQEISPESTPSFSGLKPTMDILAKISEKTGKMPIVSRATAFGRTIQQKRLQHFELREKRLLQKKENKNNKVCLVFSKERKPSRTPTSSKPTVKTAKQKLLKKMRTKSVVRKPSSTTRSKHTVKTAKQKQVKKMTGNKMESLEMPKSCSTASIALDDLEIEETVAANIANLPTHPPETATTPSTSGPEYSPVTPGPVWKPGTLCIEGKKFSSISDFEKYNDFMKTPEQPMYFCTVCNKCFPKLKPYTNHINVFHLEQRYRCNFNTCNFACHVESVIKTHVQTHYVCKYSPPGTKFWTILDFEKYNDSVKTADQPMYFCTVCNKSFPRLKPFTNHIPIFHLEPRHKCKFPSCEFTCYVESVMKTHVKSHYVCKVFGCHKHFDSKEELEAHKKTDHTKAQLEELEAAEKLLRGATDPGQ